jgi:anti-sigma regulatory factor (Ser/Thr protein kinase)
MKIDDDDDPPTATRLEERLPGSLDAASTARTKLDAIRDLLPPDRFEDARLLVNELVTNSIRHAGAIDTGWIGLRIVATPSQLRIEVIDQGPGFDPHFDPPTLEQTSGRGLFLVDALADRWGVDTVDGTSVWAEMDLS